MVRHSTLHSVPFDLHATHLEFQVLTKSRDLQGRRNIIILHFLYIIRRGTSKLLEFVPNPFDLFTKIYAKQSRTSCGCEANVITTMRPVSKRVYEYG